MNRKKMGAVLVGVVLAAGTLLADEVDMPTIGEGSLRQIGIGCILGSVAVAIIGGALVRWLARKRKRDDVADLHHSSSAC